MVRDSSTHYEPLNGDNSSDETLSPDLDDDTIDTPKFRADRSPLFYTVYASSVIFNFVGLVWGIIQLYHRVHSVPWRGTPPLYSPLDDIVSYEQRVFPSLLDRSIYHGPPDDTVDAAWSSLYDGGMSIITGWESSKLINTSYPYPGLEDRYIVSIDVFHQLHCLNAIRQFVWPERYPEAVRGRYAISNGVVFDHVDHCINSIRQSLMCNADVTPDVWKIPPGKNISEVQFNTLHTCRNFDAIQEWARVNASPAKLDDKLADALPNEVLASWNDVVKAGLAYIPEEHEHDQGVDQ